jgi:hypothetical protein
VNINNADANQRRKNERDPSISSCIEYGQVHVNKMTKRSGGGNHNDENLNI